MTLRLIISIVLMVLGMIFVVMLLNLFCAFAQSSPLKKEYLIILIWFFLSIHSNILNPIIIADESPTFSMIALPTGAIVNIILDPVFIFAFDIPTVTFFKEIKRRENKETVKPSIKAHPVAEIKESQDGVIVTTARYTARKESGLDKSFILQINKNSPIVSDKLYLSTEPIEQAVLTQNKITRKTGRNYSLIHRGKSKYFS